MMDSLFFQLLLISALAAFLLLISTHGIDGLFWHLWLFIGGIAEGLRQFKIAFRSWSESESKRLLRRGIVLKPLLEVGPGSARRLPAPTDSSTHPQEQIEAERSR